MNTTNWLAEYVRNLPQGQGLNSMFSLSPQVSGMQREAETLRRLNDPTMSAVNNGRFQMQSQVDDAGELRRTNLDTLQYALQSRQRADEDFRGGRDKLFSKEMPDFYGQQQPMQMPDYVQPERTGNAFARMYR